MDNSPSNLELFLYFDPGYSKKEQAKILSSFEGLGVKVDEKAVIGAGADGLQPSIHLLIELGELFVAGIIGAISADVWAKIKKAIKKFSRVKPSSFGQEMPPGIDIPLSGELILWIHFKDRKILATLSFLSKDIDKALDSLPAAIMKAFSKYKSETVSLWWDDEKWGF